jgi:hypothetical protein
MVLRRLIKAFAIIAASAAPVLCPVGAQADLIFSLGSTFNGSTPTSTPPWLTADFANTATPGTVQLTLTSSLNVSSEFMTQVAFNVDPTILPSSLTITPVSCVTCTLPTVANTTDNAQNLPGGGAQGMGFDVLVSFATAAAGRFNGTDVATFTLASTGLTENSFNFTNSADGLRIAAHVQGIPCVISPTCPEGTTSGAITEAPEPDSLALLGAGLLAIGIGITLRRRRSAATVISATR